MANPITSFDQLLTPLSSDRFLAEYHHREPLHIRGAADKFESVMSWEVLNRLLAMDVWTAQTLQLCLDRRQLPAAAYCRRTVDRNRQQIMQPDSKRVTALLREGATLLINEIESLHPGVLSVVQAIAETLNARSAANLYCSWAGRQGFDSHFDRHDVYALQIVGHKRWRIYEGRIYNPIEHAIFHNVRQAEYDRLKGGVVEEVALAPGDLLYLPRGQFHDALASSEASLHVTISCSEPTGLDWLTTVWERLVYDARYRAYLPIQAGRGHDDALRAELTELVDVLRELALGEQGLAETRDWLRSYPIPRNVYDLPSLEPSPGSGQHLAPDRSSPRGIEQRLDGLVKAAKRRRG